MRDSMSPEQVEAAMDQFATLLENTATVVASYYNSLIKNGVPEEFARVLVADWHVEFWKSRLNRP